MWQKDASWDFFMGYVLRAGEDGQAILLRGHLERDEDHRGTDVRSQASA